MSGGDSIAAVVLLYLAGRELRKKTDFGQRGPAPKQLPPAPPKKIPAALYKLPADGYDTVRMAFKGPGGKWVEMGIFANEKAARDVAAGKGWVIVRGTESYATREAALRAFG